MIETRGRKANRGLPVKSDACRIFRKAKETVIHWLSEPTRLVATKYLKRNSNVLMIQCAALGIQKGLFGKIRNGAMKVRVREQSLRMMNVSYVGTLNIIYVKQQQQSDQI